MGGTVIPGVVAVRDRGRAFRIGIAIVAAAASLLAGGVPAAEAAQAQIVYDSGSSPSGLWLMNADGTSPHSFIPGAGGATYSSDGSKIAYQVGGSVDCNVNFGGGQIVAANADGSHPVTIGAGGCSPRISPDGTRVMYLGTPVNGSPNPVFIASLSNPTHPQSIISPNCISYVTANYLSYPNYQSVCVANQLAAWVNNNKVVLSGYQNGLWEQSASVGNPVPILSGGDQSSDWYNGLSVSPDGSTIAGYPLSQSAGGLVLATVPSGGGSLKVLFTQSNSSSTGYLFPQWLDNQTLALQHISGSGGTTTDRVAVTPANSFSPKDLNPSDTNASFPALAPPASKLTLSGTVLDRQGAGLVGVRILINGQAAGGGAVSTGATTGAGGGWNVTLGAGTYVVRPTGKPPAQKTTGIYQTKRCDGTATITSSGDVCQVSGSGSKQADFVFKPSDHVLTLSFSPGSVAADGLGHFTGAAKDVDKTGAPVSGESISFIAPLDVLPRALICSPTGLVYPRLLSDGSPLGSGFGLDTDSAGLVPLSVWGGTTPGDWLLQASETADSSVSASLLFPFADRGGAFVPATITDDLYRAVRATIGGLGINLFAQAGATHQSEASNQAVLLAFLELNQKSFPGVAFGPVHAGNHAGVVFYRYGTTDPRAGVVIDVAQAVSIIDAAGTGQPIPPAAQLAPSLSAWAAQNGAASAQSALGSLSPPPNERLLYFGFPYPPPVNSAAAEVSFYGPCLQPDPALQEVQTHSPVVLTFTGAHHYRFGLNAKGRPVGSGAGFVVRNGDQVTYVVPTGHYSVAVDANGSGPATIVTLSPGRHATSVKTFSLRVRRRQHGSFTLGGRGPSGSLRFAGRRLRPAAGLPLSVRGFPGRLRHGHSLKVKLKLSSLGSSVAGALITVSGHARGGAVTNQRGTATLTIRPKKGKVTITLTAPGFRTVRRTLVAH